MNLYADMHCTILVFLQIGGLHMRSAVWSVLNWGDADCGRGFKWNSLRPLAMSANPKNLPELPEFLHIVPDGITFQQHRRQVLRRLAHMVTCGLVRESKRPARRFDPIRKHVADATNATLDGLRRLDPSPHVAAAWEAVQHSAQKALPPWAPSESSHGDDDSISSAGADSSAASHRSHSATAQAEAGTSTRNGGVAQDEDGDGTCSMPGKQYTVAQARLLLSALHAWRYAKVSPGVLSIACQGFCRDISQGLPHYRRAKVGVSRGVLCRAACSKVALPGHRAQRPNKQWPAAATPELRGYSILAVLGGQLELHAARVQRPGHRQHPDDAAGHARHELHDSPR